MAGISLGDESFVTLCERPESVKATVRGACRRRIVLKWRGFRFCGPQRVRFCLNERHPPHIYKIVRNRMKTGELIFALWEKSGKSAEGVGC